MGKNTLIGLAAVAVIVILVVLMFPVKTAPDQPQPADAPETQSEEAIYVNLGSQEGSTQTGLATLDEIDGQVIVGLSLTDAPLGVAQPAHIHSGACPDVGEVAYPLESPVDGVSQTILETSLEILRDQMPLAINVHKSAAEPSVYVSCGNLPL